MLPRHFLQPGESKRARATVFWTDRAGAGPNRWAVLYCTDRRLVLGAPRVSPLTIVVLWPILGVIGVVYAGLPGALAAAAFLFMIRFAPPQLIVRTLPLASVSRCVLFQSQGWRRLTTRDVIEVTATEAGGADTSVWRLSASGRNRTSAETIVEALRKVGVTVALSQPEHEASTQN